MGPLPFAQDIRGDTGWREGKGRKESCLSSFSISISRDQTGYLDSEQMVLLSTKPNNRNSYSLRILHQDRKLQGVVWGPSSVYSLIHIIVTVTPKVLSIVEI